MKLFAFITSLFFLTYLSTSSIKAQDVTLIDLNSPFYNLQRLTMRDFVRVGVSLVFIFAGIVSFFYLLLGGVNWINAGGDKEAIEKSRRRIVQSIVGLVIVFSVYVIIKIIEHVFQINLLAGTLPMI